MRQTVDEFDHGGHIRRLMEWKYHDHIRLQPHCAGNQPDTKQRKKHSRCELVFGWKRWTPCASWWRKLPKWNPMGVTQQCWQTSVQRRCSIRWQCQLPKRLVSFIQEKEREHKRKNPHKNINDTFEIMQSRAHTMIGILNFEIDKEMDGQAMYWACCHAVTNAWLLRSHWSLGIMTQRSCVSLFGKVMQLLLEVGHGKRMLSGRCTMIRVLLSWLVQPHTIARPDVQAVCNLFPYLLNYFSEIISHR